MSKIPPHGARFRLDINPDDPDCEEKPLLFRPGTPLILRYVGDEVISTVRWLNNGAYIDGRIGVNSDNEKNEPPIKKVYCSGEVCFTGSEGGRLKLMTFDHDCYLEKILLEGDVIKPGEVFAEIVPIRGDSVLLIANQALLKLTENLKASESLARAKKVADAKLKNAQIGVFVGLTVACALFFFQIPAVGFIVFLLTVIAGFVLVRRA